MQHEFGLFSSMEFGGPTININFHIRSASHLQLSSKYGGKGIDFLPQVSATVFFPFNYSDSYRY